MLTILEYLFKKQRRIGAPNIGAVAPFVRIDNPCPLPATLILIMGNINKSNSITQLLTLIRGTPMDGQVVTVGGWGHATH